MSNINTNSNIVLGIFAIMALLAFFIVENSRRDVKLDWYQEKLEAANLAKSAARCIRDHRVERGDDSPRPPGKIWAKTSLKQALTAANVSANLDREILLIRVIVLSRELSEAFKSEIWPDKN